MTAANLAADVRGVAFDVLALGEARVEFNQARADDLRTWLQAVANGCLRFP
jgi:hypothetical protein